MRDERFEDLPVWRAAITFAQDGYRFTSQPVPGAPRPSGRDHLERAAQEQAADESLRQVNEIAEQARRTRQRGRPSSAEGDGSEGDTPGG